MSFVKNPLGLIYLCFGRTVYISGQDMIKNLKEGVDYELI